MTVHGWICDLAPDRPPPVRSAAAANLMELLTHLTLTLRSKSGGLLIWERDREDDVARVMLKLCQRAAQGRGLGSGTTDGEQITYLKVILANQARDRGRRAWTRGPETHIDDPDVHVEPVQPEPEEPLIDRLPADLRDLVRASAADRNPERRLVEDVLSPALEAAREARRSDNREVLDQSWWEMIVLNFEGADSVQLLIKYGGYNPSMPSTLAAKRNAREQRHRSCRNNILRAAQRLHDDGVWGVERLEFAKSLIESLKNPQSA